MNNRMFCLLLASVLMITGAIASQLMKSEKENEAETAAPVQSDAMEESRSFLMSGQVCEPFGAHYSEVYGQWTFREYMTMKPGTDDYIYAPTGGVVESVEKAEEGICLTIANGEETIRMWPVSGVRVFEGSHIEKGMIIAAAGELLSVSVEKRGKAIDPNELFGSENEN